MEKLKNVKKDSERIAITISKEQEQECQVNL